jgi:predicted amidohydrolase
MAAHSPALRVAIAQIDTTVGDIPGNTRKIAEQIARAR